MRLYDAIDRLIEYAVSYRGILGTTRLGVQVDITEAAAEAGQWVGEMRHADEMTEARYAEDVAREPVTCARCLALAHMRRAQTDVSQSVIDLDADSQTALDNIHASLEAVIDANVHDEAEGCDHDVRDNFTDDGSDDGPDSLY